MRTLNCKRTARILSLYVAGDLVGAPEREVAAHLAACEACCRLSEEFSESRSLLTQAFTTPEFGAEFYSGIRSAVLDEITRDRMLSKPSLFRPRWLYATAFAVVVIVSGLALQHFGRTRRETPPDLALARPVQPTSPSSEMPSSRRKHELPGKPSIQSNKVLALANPHGSSRQVAGVKQPDALMTSQAARDKRTQIEQAVQSSTSAEPIAVEASSQVSRIEIQTADPNIRIIWLSPRESRVPEENNHDQDRDQNGNRK
jgi:anti-sigma factor RsiW